MLSYLIIIIIIIIIIIVIINIITIIDVIIIIIIIIVTLSSIPDEQQLDFAVSCIMKYYSATYDKCRYLDTTRI